MKLTIDTQHDTIDDIKKIMRVLSEVINNKEQSTIQSDVDTTNMMDMFSDKRDKTTEGTPIDFSGFMDLVNQKETSRKESDSTEPRIVSY